MKGSTLTDMCVRLYCLFSHRCVEVDPLAMFLSDELDPFSGRSCKLPNLVLRKSISLMSVSNVATDRKKLQAELIDVSFLRNSGWR